jgi:hypothetical protein
MQIADIVLAILVPLVASALGWVGVEMSLTPQEGLTHRTRRNYRIAMLLLVLAAVVLSIWQTTRNIGQQNQEKEASQKREGELSNKVSEQGGKLDAIAHFEQQFLAFVSASRSAGTPDAASKAYEAMALTVLRMAQPAASQPDAHLVILYQDGELNGRTISIPAPSNVSPIAIQLSEFRFKNNGGHVTAGVSARLYLSKTVSSTSIWQPTLSDDPDFPFAYYSGGGLGGGFGGALSPIINPQETWNWMAFQGQLPAGQTLIEPIKAKLKVFYGTAKPAEAIFSIQRKE